MALEAFNQLKDKKKTHLLNAITNCLRKTNYDDLTVNEIVDEAGISRGSFYNYFNNKNDAVLSLVESKLKEHFESFIEAVKDSDYRLFDGTRKVYYDIENILSDEINLALMKNLKFFSELWFESMKSHKYKQYLDDKVKWLVENSYEGKNYLNTSEKMSNILDIILSLILNTIFLKIVHDHSDGNNNERDSFEYKLSIIEKGIR
jgi:AcrR family transcriptional regulator